MQDPCIQSLKRSDYFFIMPCVHRVWLFIYALHFTLFALIVYKVPIVSSLCIFKAFTLHSSFVHQSLNVLLDHIIFWMITIHTKCSSFVIFSWLQTKYTVRISPEALLINHSSYVHIAFTYCSPRIQRSLCTCICTPFALCIHRS